VPTASLRRALSSEPPNGGIAHTPCTPSVNRFGSRQAQAAFAAPKAAWTGLSSSDLVVGFLLGFALISRYTLGSSAAAQMRGQQFRTRLMPWQGMFGLVAIVMALLYLVM